MSKRTFLDNTDIDTTYSSKSTNAQSGTAVHEALLTAESKSNKEITMPANPDDEQYLSAKAVKDYFNKKVGDNYELITTVSVSEDVATIEIDNLQIKNVLLVIRYGSAFSGKSVTMSCKFSQNLINVSSGGNKTNFDSFRTISSNLANAVGFASCQKVNGLYSIEISNASTNQANIPMDSFEKNLNFVLDETDSAYIEKITLTHQDVFAAGTNIRVYGVRA